MVNSLFYQDGFEIKPVTGGFKLNKDYFLFYSNNLHAGKATVMLKELGNYEGMKGAEEKGKVAVTLTGKGDFTDTVTKKVKAK